ncbi:MAG: geranylgeranylglyceryl/heptaprenylglyceryl phosphate synthase [Gilvibacter sp.]
MTSTLQSLQTAQKSKTPLLAILIDPDKFDPFSAPEFVRNLPITTSHLFIGGSTVEPGATKRVVSALKTCTALPLVLFPGDYSQIDGQADALLFLSLLSGNNPEYLIGQQIKAVPRLQHNQLEVIPTGYILIDGGNDSAVSRVTNTTPIDQNEQDLICDTAMAAQYMGKRCIYLEAGSGAIHPVRPEIIEQVVSKVDIPVIVGGGIRADHQLQAAYQAGATMVVMGTVFEQ